MKEIKVKCLSCGSLEGGDFCGGCHTVLPIEGSEDIDCFELFGLERRPYVELTALKERFFDLSQRLHPDHNMGVSSDTRIQVLAVSAQLNRSYATLTNTRERLRYLVGKETEQEPPEAKQVPAEMMELFFEVHDLMQEVDAYLKNRKPATNRLMAALEMGDEEKMALLSKIRDMRARSDERVTAVEAEVRFQDDAWDAKEDRAASVARLNQLADVLSYLGRLRSSLDQKELALKTS